MQTDYLRWHPAQVASGDIDPMYPVLRHIADEWGLDAEQRAWLVVLHVVWYHPGSTLVAFQICDTAAKIPTSASGLAELGLLDLPCETERRGHRSKPALVNHLLGLRRAFGADGVWDWAQQAIEGQDGQDMAWLAVNDWLTSIPGNGRWAAYKTAEMWQKVCGLPIVAADAGHRYSSGPRQGLELLEGDLPKDNSPLTIDLLDYMTEVWADRLGEPDLAQVETSLCDFHSLATGRYYLGHDIDSMQEAWLHPKVASQIPPEAWRAREVLAYRFLGEHNGWRGVRRHLNTEYRATGVMRYV